MPDAEILARMSTTGFIKNMIIIAPSSMTMSTNEHLRVSRAAADWLGSFIVDAKSSKAIECYLNAKGSTKLSSKSMAH